MTTKMGWCLDGLHKSCRASYEYEGNMRYCSCECHGHTAEAGRGKTSRKGKSL